MGVKFSSDYYLKFNSQTPSNGDLIYNNDGTGYDGDVSYIKIFNYGGIVDNIKIYSITGVLGIEQNCNF